MLRFLIRGNHGRSPDSTLSMAFLPAAFGSASGEGIGITLRFPYDSIILCGNSQAWPAPTLQKGINPKAPAW